MERDGLGSNIGSVILLKSVSLTLITMSSTDFVLFAQHGWADTHQAIASLSHALVPDTIPVIAPNLGWFCTWVRIEPLIQHVEQTAMEALQHYPDHPWRIIGHSMGGLIWVDVLHRHPDWWSRIHSLCLVGSPDWRVRLGSDY